MSTSKHPKIRFKDENGNDYPDWEEKNLGEMFEIKKGIQISKKNLSLNGQKCILYGELFTRYDEIIEDVISKTDLDVLPNSKYYDILMPSSDVTPNGLAKASCLLENDVILGGDMNILRYKDENVFPPFFSYQINYFKKKIMDVVSGTTIKHVYSKNIEKLNYEVPLCIDEQEKIASFFMLLDKRIEQQEQKIALLKDYKKAMMQKIFSQKIRFKDENGNDYPDWEEKKLGKICRVKSSQLTNNVVEEIGKYPVYGANSIVGYTENYEVNKYVSIVKDGAGVGRIAFINNKSSVLGTLQYLIGIEITTEFLYVLLSNVNFKLYQTGTTIPHIYFKDYSKMIIDIPCQLEQEKISSFLFAMDLNLENQEAILNNLKEQKQGLLRKMFV